MKTIRQGETLIITGRNIYPETATSVYWNSSSESNKAEIVPDTFIPNTQVRVSVPCCLPDLNKVVVCNSVGCITGQQPYVFIGSPEIDSFSPEVQYWGQPITVKGNHLEDTTGISIGQSEVTQWDWPSSKKLTFKIPREAENGFIKIYTDIGYTTSTQEIKCHSPSIYGELTSNAGKNYGDTIEIKGEGLHKVNRIKMSGIQEDILVAPAGFSGLASTGITFFLPEGVVDNSPLRLQQQSGYFQNGSFVENVIEEFKLPEKIGIKSIYIKDINTNASPYNHPVTLSGVNLKKSQTFFLGHHGEYIEGTTIGSGDYYKTVNVPKNIKRGAILESGNASGYEGIAHSRESFYPLPTIQSISTTSWTAGGQVVIEAINASEAFEAVGVSGLNLLNGVDGGHFVSNPTDEVDFQAYFGQVSFDDSSLLQDPIGGSMKIYATINSAMVGVGHPFLVSAHEAVTTIKASQLDLALSGSNTYKNLNQLTGQQVAISGKKPNIIGLSKYKAGSSDLLAVSGNYFFTSTGMKLAGETQVKTIPKSDFVRGIYLTAPTTQGADVAISSIYNTAEHISVVRTGGYMNDYEQLHVALVNLNDFNFTEKSGNFTIVTPYHA